MDSIFEGTELDLQAVLDQSIDWDLDHEFKLCALEDVSIEGNIDYKDIVSCEDGGFEFDIVGQIETITTGLCEIDARENCDGTYQGFFCGKTL